MKTKNTETGTEGSYSPGQEMQEKITEKDSGYFEAEFLKVVDPETGVSVVCRKPWSMNGQKQPAAIEIIEARKPVKIMTRKAAETLAKLLQTKKFNEFLPYLSEIQDINTLEKIS